MPEPEDATPAIQSNAEEYPSQMDLTAPNTIRKSGPAMHDSIAGNQVHVSGAKIGRGSIIGGDSILNKKTQVSTGGIFVAIVAVIALLVIAIIVTREVAGSNTNNSSGATPASELGDSGSNSSSGVQQGNCPGPVSASAISPNAHTLVDNVGDACFANKQDPIADVESLAFTSGPSSVTFTVLFAGNVTGRESAGISMASDPAGVDQSCGATHVSLNFYPEGKVTIYSGCNAAGEVQASSTGSYLRLGNKLTTTLQKSALPITGNQVYLRANVETGLSVTPTLITETPITDYLPDHNLPPAKIAV